MTEKSRHTKIIDALGQHRNQTYSELWSACKMGRQSFADGLKELLSNGTIGKKDGKFFLKKEIQNKTLKAVLNHKSMKYSPLDVAAQLKKLDKQAIPPAYAIIRSCSVAVSKLSLELHANILSEFDKELLDKAIKHYNEVMRVCFETVNTIDPDQASDLKKAIDLTATKSFPDEEFKYLKYVKPRRLKHVARIVKKAGY